MPLVINKEICKAINQGDSKKFQKIVTEDTVHYVPF
jgi:hypothetical protein